MQLVSFWKEIPHKQTPKLGGGKKKILWDKRVSPSYNLPRKSCTNPNAETAEGTQARCGPRRTWFKEEREETGRVGSMRGDEISSKPKRFSISSDLFPHNQLPAVPCRLQSNWGQVSTEKSADGKPKTGLQDHGLGSGKSLPLTGSLSPQLSDGRAALDDSKCPCLVCLPRVSESQSVVMHAISPTSSPAVCCTWGQASQGCITWGRMTTFRFGAENQTWTTRQKNEWLAEKAVTRSNQFVWKILSPTAVALSRF